MGTELKVPALDSIRRYWVLYSVRGTVVGVNFVAMLFIALMMHPAQFGRFVLAWSIVQVFASIISLGGPTYLLREMSARQANDEYGVGQDFVIRLTLLYPALLALLISVTIVGVMEALDVRFEGDAIEPSIFPVIAGIAYLLNGLAVLVSFLRVGGEVSLSMVIGEAGPQLVLIVVCALLAMSGVPQAFELLIGCLFGLLLLNCALVVWVRVKSQAGIKYFRNSSIKEREKYTLSFWGSSMASNFSSQADILIGGMLVSPQNLGIYQIIKRFANLVGLPQIIANWATSVDIGKSFAQQDKAALQGLAVLGIKLSLLPAIAILTILSLSLPYLLGFFSIGSTFENLLSFTLIVAAVLTNMVFGTNFLFAAQCHLERHALIARLLGIAAMAAVMFAPIGSIDIVRLALSFLVATLCSNFYLWRVLNRRIGIESSVLALFRGAVGRT